MFIQRPEPGEYAPYYGKYISLIPSGDILHILEQQLGDVQAMLAGIPESRETHRYAPGKWSIREVMGHLADCERVFGYRALWIARGETTPLPGFDEDAFVGGARFDACPLRDLSSELEYVRRANVALFRALDEAAWQRRGSANEHAVSVRAIACILAGHTAHHAGVIKERYL